MTANLDSLTERLGATASDCEAAFRICTLRPSTKIRTHQAPKTLKNLPGELDKAERGNRPEINWDAHRLLSGCLIDE